MSVTITTTGILQTGGTEIALGSAARVNFFVASVVFKIEIKIIVK